VTQWVIVSLVCSIRSLHEERLTKVLRGRDVGLIVYDECHHAAAEDNQFGIAPHADAGFLTMLPQSEVERIFHQRLIIGPDIQRDRQRELWGNTGAGGVKRKLSDWDTHTPDSKIA